MRRKLARDSGLPELKRFGYRRNIARIIRAERRNRGWSSSELGRKAGLSRRQVKRAEAKNPEAGWMTILAILRALKLDLVVAPLGTENYDPDQLRGQE